MTIDDEEERRIEREIRSRRSADPAAILAGLDGGGHLKGASPTPVLQRATLEIEHWLADHLHDPAGVLRDVIVRRLAGRPELIESGLGQPAVSVGTWLHLVLPQPAAVAELVREVDMEWGRRLGERPRFEVAGQPAAPDDPYTIAGVTALLTELCKQCPGR